MQFKPQEGIARGALFLLCILNPRKMKHNALSLNPSTCSYLSQVKQNNTNYKTIPFHTYPYFGPRPFTQFAEN